MGPEFGNAAQRNCLALLYRHGPAGSSVNDGREPHNVGPVTVLYRTQLSFEAAWAGITRATTRNHESLQVVPQSTGNTSVDRLPARCGVQRLPRRGSAPCRRSTRHRSQPARGNTPRCCCLRRAGRVPTAAAVGAGRADPRDDRARRRSGPSRHGGEASPALRTDLVELGGLEASRNGFRVGTKLFALGGMNPAVRHLRAMSMPVLYDLCARSHWMANLAVRSGDRALLVEEIYCDEPVPAQMIGARLPLHATANGRH